MSGLHRYSANAVLDAILIYKRREGEWPSQRALAVEADRSLAHVNAQVKILVEKGYVKMSKTGRRIIAAHSESQEKEDV